MELLIGGIAIVLIVQAMAGMKRTTERLHDIEAMQKGQKPATPENVAQVQAGNAKDRGNLTWLYVLAAIGLFLALASAGAL